MNWEYPTASFPKSESAPSIPKDRRIHFSPPALCAACCLVRPSTRHHIVPKEVERTTATVTLCWPCHTVIHRLPNWTIAGMSEAEQIAYIRSR